MMRLRELRKQSGLKQSEIAEILHVTQGTYSLWENGKVNINPDAMEKLTRLFNVPEDYITGRESDWIPVLGSVAAGIPSDAIQEYPEDFEQIDFPNPQEYFALRVKGDSMSPKFSIGDVVIVHKQATINTDEIAVVLVDKEATVKQVKITEDGIWLVPFNPSYPPKFFTYSDIKNTPVKILGKVVELRCKF